MRAFRLGWIAAFCLIAFPLTAQTSRTSERVTGWRSDADHFVAELGRQHYVLRRGSLPESVRAAAARFKRGIPSWSDERALAELMRIAATAGDGHTYVLPFGAQRVRSTMLPLRFYQFADGMFVIDAEPGLERWIGSRVRAMGGIAPPDLLRRLRPYIARDNDIGILWAGPFLLRFTGYLEAITNSRFSGGIPVVLRRGSRDTTLVLRPVPVPRMRGVPKLIASRLTNAQQPPLYLRDVATPHWMQPLNDSVLYVQFNQVADGPNESLATFTRRLEATLREAEPKQLIIDVRHNNGGNAELLHPLIAVLRRFTQNSGRLVVISGRNTFSAAQIFLARAEHQARAVVVGEPSSSKPNFVGEENNINLRWSGAIASISNRYHENIPGDTRQWIEPRPEIRLRSQEYFRNQDPVLSALLRGF
jgi:hypothetical protein